MNIWNWRQDGPDDDGVGQRLAETGDAESAGRAEEGDWGLTAMAQGDQAYSPSSPSSSTWSAQLGFELRVQICGRKRLSQRGEAPAAAAHSGPITPCRTQKPPPRLRSATLDSLKVSGRHRKTSTHQKPGPETGSDGRTRLPVPRPTLARLRRPQRPLRMEVDWPVAFRGCALVLK